MKKIFQRLLLFAIGLPLILGIVLFLPHYNHLALNIVVVLFSSLGAAEFAVILGKKGIAIHPAEAVILGTLAPLAMTVTSSFNQSDQMFFSVFILGASWLLVFRVLSSGEKLKRYTVTTAAGFSIMMYPGLFMAWVVRMTMLPGAEMVILIFLLMVFANDSAAWAAGMLLGKGSRGIISASPNKSIPGFIGGIGASILIGAGVVVFIPDAFVSNRLPRFPAGIIIGFATGIAATLGDLAESAMKRSSGIKDSGTIVPGRGGVLDTIDSISLAAPVFYVLYRFFF